MSIAAAIRAEIASKGAIYTLRRETAAAGANDWTRGAVTVTYYRCRARERMYKPDEVRGGILETDTLITVDAASIAVTPRKGDKLALGVFASDTGADWRLVISAYEPRVGGANVVYKLQARD